MDTNTLSFTFGIITEGKFDNFIQETIKSIEANNIPEYEIIIVGNTEIESTDKIHVFEFDENVHTGWLTRKKNIIIEQSKNEILVIMHDYILFDKDWYNGFVKYGNNFDWCISPIKNANGNRYRDYTLFPYKVNSSLFRTLPCPFEDDYLNVTYSLGDEDDYFNGNCLLPYDFENNININKYMYISGAYFIIKREIALKHKLDETLFICQGEDVEYSKRLHNHGHIIKCNPHSFVRLQKLKDSAFWENLISDEKMELLKKISNK
jgi:GT2 family glycosyltransferase